MKKKTIIILGAVAVIAVGGIVTVNALNKNAQQVAVKQAPKDDWGIDYFDVPDLQQIYINGVIQPEQMNYLLMKMRRSQKKLRHNKIA